MGHEPLEHRFAQKAPAGKQVIERAAQAVNVGAVVDAVGVVGLFGGHEIEGAHVHAALGQPAAGGLVEGVDGVDDAGQSQVEHADGPVESMMRLAGLMSRWMIPLACAASRPRAAWIRQSRA